MIDRAAVGIRSLAAGAALLLALVLGGCATPQTGALLNAPGDLPPRAELTSVPFFPQEQYQCGPASLATALVASGIQVTPEALVSRVYLPGREGSLQVEMLAAARRYGRISVQMRPQLRDVLAEIAAGNPVVVLQNLALSWYPRWHYAVAVGYELQAGNILLRSGRTEREVLPLTTFEHTWGRSDRWAILVLPPDRLPATVPADAYVSAVTAVERAGAIRPAQTAYRTALQRWPNHLAALVGLGNTAYALHDMSGAEQAFRRAVAAHPRSDAALNNLAQVLSERGRYKEAADTARRAVDLNGPNRAVAERTLQEIRVRQTKGVGGRSG